MPWDGRRVEPGGERGRAEVIVRYEPDGGSGQPPGGRKRRSFLVLLLALLMVAILAIVVLVITRPKANSALDKPSPAASATSASPSATSPSASGSMASPAATGTSGAGSSPSTIQASGGGAGAEVADLSALNPVQTGGISGPSNGPEQIGATIYQNSVGFTCYNDNPSYIDYNVAGYKFLNAVIGVPSSASNAAGNSMTVTFFKDGSSNQLSTPVTVSLGPPAVRSPEPGRIIPARDRVYVDQRDQPFPGKHGRRSGQRHHWTQLTRCGLRRWRGTGMVAQV
jgi:hypothetical protein